MPGILRSVRRACLQIGQHGGALSAVADSEWRRGRLLIIAYHGVSLDDEHLWDPAFFMPPQQLADRLRLVSASGCHVLPLAEGIERLYAGELPPRSVTLTFDDGFHNFVECAFPLLKEHGYPATAYLPTLHCGKAAPVFAPACSYILWKARGRRVQLPGIRNDPFDLRTAHGVHEAAEAVRSAARRDKLNLTDKNLLLKCVARAAGVDYDGLAARGLLRVMSPADVQQLAAQGVDFELHTHRHKTPADRASFAEEIETNRARLLEMTGRRPQHFCYPSGEYEPRFLPWLRELSVASATTCDPGLAARDTPPLMLPRLVDKSTTSSIEFQGWLSGAASLLTPRRSYAHAAPSA